jgi:hypothetical protein
MNAPLKLGDVSATAKSQIEPNKTAEIAALKRNIKIVFVICPEQLKASYGDD